MMYYRKTGKRLSVLIVDDNEEFVDRMVDLLVDVENISSIQTASDYNEAFRMLDNKAHDVVLLDINLSGKNGIQLLQKIQELGWNCNVIMITNSSGGYYKKQCKKLGVTHFLDKTNEFEKVPMIITSISPN